MRQPILVSAAPANTSDIAETISWLSTEHPLVLTNRHDEWSGTFGVLVAALMADLLPEGPFDATLLWTTDEGAVQSFTGKVQAFDAGHAEITIADDAVKAFVYLHQILAVAVH